MISKILEKKKKRLPIHYKKVRQDIDNGLLIVVLGVSGSGKSDLVEDLCEAYKVHRIKTFTTKPPSKWDATKYRFVTQREFDEKLKRGELTLLKKDTVPSNDELYVSKYHYYGAEDTIIGDGGIIILDWEGYTDLLSMRQSNVIAFLLNTDVSSAYFKKLSSSPEDADSRDKFLSSLVSSGEVFNSKLIDELSLDFPIYKINAKVPRDEIFQQVDSILKGL